MSSALPTGPLTRPLSPPQRGSFARLGRCCPDGRPLCSPPGLEVILCNHISVKGGLAARQSRPAFLWPALGNVTISTNTSFSWGPGGNPAVALLRGTGAKEGRALGTKSPGPRGIPVPFDPLIPHRLTGPCGATSGLSHLRGHSQALGPEKAFPGTLPTSNSSPCSPSPGSIPSGKPTG